MDKITELLDRIGKQQAELEEYQRQAKEKIGELKQELFYEIEDAFMRCELQDTQKLASKIYWYGIDHDGITGNVRAIWKEFFGNGFTPDPIESGTSCAECGCAIMVTSVSAYRKPDAVCKQCQDDHQRKNHLEYEARERQDQERLRELRSMPYREYLQTPEWDVTRKAAIKRAKYHCQLCNSNGQLNVHHRSYERIGQEYSYDLIVLCSDCHARFHDKQGGIQ